MSLPLCNTLSCWAPNQRVQNMNGLTPPERMLKKKRAVPQVHWTLSPMLVRVKRWKPLGAHPGCPLPRGTAEGIAPCKGSIPGHVKNFEGLRISALVSHCFERLLKRMPFPIGIGIARSKMPCREATMPPRLRSYVCVLGGDGQEQCQDDQ